ncbi:MAG: flagellar motor switch protein FliG [Spirochaetaceae bacterium]|jgi:flagellar motor switch protein FliG|nr:flagellar motor switch protein FliG [Spirochaetaceae bacterium]
MAKERGIDAYKKMIKGGKEISKEDSDWLERVAMADEELLTKPDGFIKIPRVSKPAATPESGAVAGAPTGGKDSKYRRVAKFLILIGAGQAASVLSNLDDEQVELISREIASIRGITKEESEEIFAEFQALLSGADSGAAGSAAYGAGTPYGGGAPVGGVDEARRLLYAAFGAEKGERFLKKAIPRETSFDFLDDLSGEQIAMLFRDESPATGAMILSRIAPKSAAAALTHAESAWRLEVARRIGHIGQVSPEVLERAAEALREKARHISAGGARSAVDGLGALASILKQSDIGFGDKILAELADADPELGRELKERLYTLDDVVKADNKPLRLKLHEMSAKEIAVLIKGREDAFVEKILSNISSGRRTEVREEIDFMGPLPKKESDAALKDFMNWFREKREEGSILMLGDDIVE